MTRIIITGRNCDLSRETFSRAARLAAASPELGRAAFYSGHQPDSAAGGSRRSDSEKETPPESTSFEYPCALGPEPPQPRLGAITRDDWVMMAVSAFICLANIAIIVLASQ